MLTKREREILKLRHQGLSDCKIARRLGLHVQSVHDSRKNAQKKLKEAKEDLAWAENIGASLPPAAETPSILVVKPEQRR